MRYILFFFCALFTAFATQTETWSNLIYKPGAPTNPPVYGSVDELTHQIDLVRGAATVYFDDSIEPIVLPSIAQINGYGRLVLTAATLYAGFQDNPVLTTVRFADGAQIIDPREVSVLHLISNSTLHPPLAFTLSSQAFIMHSGRLQVGKGSTKPFIQLSEDQTFILLADTGAFVLTDEPGVPVIRTNPVTGNDIEIFFYGPIVFNTGVIVCDASPSSFIFYIHDASVSTLDIPTCSDYLQENLLDQAQQMQYADWEEPPQIVTEPSSPAGPTVQDAIDGLKARLPIVISFTSEMGSNEVAFYPPTSNANYYLDWTFQPGTSDAATITVDSKSMNQFTFTDSVGGSQLLWLLVPSV